jgi:hypothetical protein
VDVAVLGVFWIVLYPLDWLLVSLVFVAWKPKKCRCSAQHLLLLPGTTQAQAPLRGRRRGGDRRFFFF